MQAISFQVEQAKFRSIEEKGVRTVCAYAVGTLVARAATDQEQQDITIPLGWHPKKGPEFFNKLDGKPLQPNCSRLIVVENRVFVSDDATALVRLAPVRPVAAQLDLLGMLMRWNKSHACAASAA